MTTIAYKPRMADMATTDVLAKYGIANPFADALVFTREAEKLRAALKMKTIQAGFTGVPLATYTRTTYTLTGFDEWNELIAVSRENAADCLADVARENAKRWGRHKGSTAPIAESAAAAVQYATGEQKDEIVRLLNHPAITRPEKTKHLLAIHRFTEQTAAEAIAKLNKAIADREV